MGNSISGYASFVAWEGQPALHSQVMRAGGELQTSSGKTYRRTGVLMAGIKITLVLSPFGPFTGGDKMPSFPTLPSRGFS